MGLICSAANRIGFIASFIENGLNSNIAGIKHLLVCRYAHKNSFGYPNKKARISLVDELRAFYFYWAR